MSVIVCDCDRKGRSAVGKYICAIDAGTTSNRCIVFDESGRVCGVAQREFPQYFPQPGWVEQDADEIWETQRRVIAEAMEKCGISAADIVAFGITNQRETTIVWDRTTGEPVYRAIVWQCRRTAGYCDRLRAEGAGGLINEKTGLLPDAYFSGTKLRWILQNVPGAREKAERGELLFGTVETWLIWKLTGGAVHATDYSNASRTMMFNIHTLDWDDDLLRILGVPRSMLPKVLPSSGWFGETDPGLFGGPIPICGAAGDQQAALFGQACFDEGEVKNTYGTGGFLLMNTGGRPVESANGLVTTIAWGLGGKITYALEGSVFIAGAVIKWLRDELGLIGSAAESEELASRVPDTNGCYVVPAFTGLGAPYWDPYARGTIVGLTRGVNRAHIVRAAVESIAFQINDVLDAMRADLGAPIPSVRVDGGAAANNVLLQMQADISRVPVIRPDCIETTARGAAFLAGLAAGYWKDLDELRTLWKPDRTFSPMIGEEERAKKIYLWKKAVSRAQEWEEQ